MFESAGRRTEWQEEEKWRSTSEVPVVRGRLSKPESLFTKETWRGAWELHVTIEDDPEAVTDVILRGVEAHIRQEATA